MTIIYEVNIEVDSSIESAFLPWLKQHISEVCTFDGFLGAKLLKELNVSTLRWCVHYQVQTMTHLQQYFDLHASKMRQQGIDKFGDKIKTNRRILKIED